MANVNEAVSKSLTTIAQKSHTLLRNVEEVISLLPRRNEALSGSESWNLMMDRYKLFSSQSLELNEEVKDILHHFVIAPKATGHSESGEPTTLLPDMLSTKKSLEQEKFDLEFEEENEDEKTDTLSKNEHRDGEFEKFNAKIDFLLNEFRAKETQILQSLKKTSDQLGNKLILSKKEDYEAGVLMFKYLESGTVPKTSKKFGISK